MFAFILFDIKIMTLYPYFTVLRS